MARRAHTATYATDKRAGGYIIRVSGPHSSAFVGRQVPVLRKDKSESLETLTKLIWSGKDKDTNEPVSLYAFAPRPRDEQEEVEF